MLNSKICARAAALACVAMLVAACSDTRDQMQVSMEGVSKYQSYEPLFGALASQHIAGYGGYDDDEVSDTAAQVTAYGSGSTSAERVKRIALLRIARLAEEREAERFEVTEVSLKIHCMMKNKIPVWGRPRITLAALFEPDDPVETSIFETQEIIEKYTNELAQSEFTIEQKIKVMRANRSSCWRF